MERRNPLDRTDSAGLCRYDVLVNTGFGKGILAVCLLVLLISFAAVIRLTKPVEYKR